MQEDRGKYRNNGNLGNKDKLAVQKNIRSTLERKENQRPNYHWILAELTVPNTHADIVSNVLYLTPFDPSIHSDTYVGQTLLPAIQDALLKEKRPITPDNPLILNMQYLLAFDDFKGWINLEDLCYELSEEYLGNKKTEEDQFINLENPSLKITPTKYHEIFDKHMNPKDEGKHSNPIEAVKAVFEDYCGPNSMFNAFCGRNTHNHNDLVRMLLNEYFLKIKINGEIVDNHGDNHSDLERVKQFLGALRTELVKKEVVSLDLKTSTLAKRIDLVQDKLQLNCINLANLNEASAEEIRVDENNLNGSL